MPPSSQDVVEVASVLPRAQLRCWPTQVLDTTEVGIDLLMPIRLGLFIPAYHAARTLKSVVARLPGRLVEQLTQILIIDDASTDGTWGVIQELAESNPKITAIQHDYNRGYGGVNKAALTWFLRERIDAYAVLHGDLQYAPEETHALLTPIVAGDADIVLGSRMIAGALRGGMPVDRWMANRMLTWLMNRALGTSLSDCHTGFFSCRSRAISALDPIAFSDGHEFSAELVLRASGAGLKIREVPVTTHYGSESRSCSRLVAAKYAGNVIRMVGTRPGTASSRSDQM